MSEVWSLPGYDVEALLGFGATGEVWRARDTATGEVVALKRLRPGADPAAVEALRREASLLRSLDTPHVLRLREVVGTGDAAVLVLDHAAGGSLAALLARRGALEPGEVVTIGVPLASALAAAHARGLVHGDLTPSNVLFTADGMPVLSDLGVARVAGEDRAAVDGTAEYLDPAVAAGGLPDAASDVWSLAAVLHHLLAGSPPHEGESVESVLDAAASGSRAPLGLLAPSAPRALVEAVEAGLVADPRARPDATAFASSLRRAHASAPVRLAGSAPVAHPGAARATHAVREAAPPVEARRWRPSSGQLVAAALVLLVVVGGTVGWLSGRGDPAPAGVALPAAAAPDWPVLLDDLDAARAAAFAAADAKALAAVWAPGSPGLAADTALVEQLASARQRAQGLRREVRSVEEVSRDGDRAELRVVDVLASYAVLDAAGNEVSRTPARGEAAFLVRVQRVDGAWRLAEVLPAQG